MKIKTFAFFIYILLIPLISISAETTNFSPSVVQAETTDFAPADIQPEKIEPAISAPAADSTQPAHKGTGSRILSKDSSQVEPVKSQTSTSADKPSETLKPESGEETQVQQEVSDDPLLSEQAEPASFERKEENYIVLNFDNAALRDVINTISSITGESFIVSPGLDARITIYSAGKIPTREALSVFESILEVNNMALVKSGQFYKIVQGASAKQKPIEIQLGNDSQNVIAKDRPITQIVQIEYVPATEISSILQSMLSPFGSIIPNPRNNLLIINDLSSNIKRLLAILKEIDVDAFQNTRMGFFQPKFSDVKSLSQEVKEILSSLNLGQHGIAVIPIERINSLVIFSSSSSLLKTIEGWLKKLDEEVSTGRNIFVYPLQNIKTDNIISVLKTIYESDEGARPTTTTRKTTTPAKKTQRRQVTPRPRTSEAAAFSRVEIVAFEPTNSLVILAPPGIYRDMVETIKQLDVYPQSVLIEAIIAEVTITDSDKFGIQWSVLYDIELEGDTYNYLAQNRSGDASAFNLPLALGDTSSAASLTASGLSFLLYRPERLAALVQALASKGKVNILSSPRLLVRDQEEASIEVGTDIPTATSTTSTTTTDTLTQNIEYRTVGIKLKIKPSINDEKTVVLDIEQEVSSKGADQQVGQTGNLFPSFNTTKTKTSIVVPDKQGIVIGGLMEEIKDKNYQGIPVLSNIPILGHFFRYTANTTTKKELIIIITPHVISTKSEVDIITLDFMRKLKEVKEFLDYNDTFATTSEPEETGKNQTNEQ